jgi:polar amino acid transport system substrate-binding protein
LTGYEFDKGEWKMKRTALFVSLLAALAMLLAACSPAATATPAPTTAAANTQAPAPTKIRVATDATWPPFEVVDEATKDIVGFDIDLLKAVAASQNIEVEFVNVGFDPLLAGIAQCQYDAAISAITITDDRKKEMLFTNPYFNAGQIVVVQAGNTDITSKDNLGGKKVGAQIGTTGAIEGGKISGADVRTYDTVDLAFQDLINGQIDAVIADNPLALGFVGKSPDKLKVVGNVFTDESYGIAVCNKNQALVDQLNAGLAKVEGEGLIEKLSAQWLAAGG